MKATLRTTQIRPDRGLRRLPASGNTALAASALIQTALGIEFILSGLNKFADPHYVQNFSQFVSSNPRTKSAFLSGLVTRLVLPNVACFATLLQFSQLAMGFVLLLVAMAAGRPRFLRPPRA